MKWKTKYLMRVLVPESMCCSCFQPPFIVYTFSKEMLLMRKLIIYLPSSKQDGSLVSENIWRILVRSISQPNARRPITSGCFQCDVSLKKSPRTDGDVWKKKKWLFFFQWLLIYLLFKVKPVSWAISGPSFPQLWHLLSVGVLQTGEEALSQ